MVERMFPLQLSFHDREKMGGKQVHRSIPWSVATKAYPAYCNAGGAGQSLERLAERGGFSHGEMDLFYPEWRRDVDEIPLLKAEIERLRSDPNRLPLELVPEGWRVVDLRDYGRNDWTCSLGRLGENEVVSRIGEGPSAAMLAAIKGVTK